MTNRGSFQMTYEGYTTCHAHLEYEEIPNLLFTHVIDLSTGLEVAKHIFVNVCKSYMMLQLKRGDIIELTALTQYYRQGQSYHRANVYRGIQKDYRLIYPKHIKVIGHDNSPERPILNLKNMTVYPTFLDFIQSLPNAKTISATDVSYLYIKLWDLDYKENIFNRKGNIINPQYPPTFMHADVFDMLTDDERNKILACWT